MCNLASVCAPMLGPEIVQTKGYNQLGGCVSVHVRFGFIRSVANLDCFCPHKEVLFPTDFFTFLFCPAKVELLIVIVFPKNLWEKYGSHVVSSG